MKGTIMGTNPVILKREQTTYQLETLIQKTTDPKLRAKIKDLCVAIATQGHRWDDLHKQAETLLKEN